LLVANNVVPTDTIYNWTVPNTESDSCKLRIYDNTATSVGDTSTNVFSIYKPFVTVVRPNGGERLRVGAVDSIRWNSKRVDAVSILLSTDNGLSWEPVVNSVGSVGYMLGQFQIKFRLIVKYKLEMLMYRQCLIIAMPYLKLPTQSYGCFSQRR
jgi:hypothetical protein